VTQWLTLKEGLTAAGLRIAPVREVPCPWSELCRALFHVKRIPVALISARDPHLGLSELKAATAQDTLPVVFWESEIGLNSSHSPRDWLIAQDSYSTLRVSGHLSSGSWPSCAPKVASDGIGGY
jgi:hypothetical protein